MIMEITAIINITANPMPNPIARGIGIPVEKSYELVKTTRFFYKKKVYKKMRLKSQNFMKMLRKSQGSSSTVHLLYVPEIDISSFFASSRTKIETFL